MCLFTRSMNTKYLIMVIAQKIVMHSIFITLLHMSARKQHNNKRREGKKINFYYTCGSCVAIGYFRRKKTSK